MLAMTVYFTQPPAPPAPSLTALMGLEGHITILRPKSTPNLWLFAEDNEAELVEVEVVKKRNLHVVTDRMLKARATMDEPVEGNFNLRRAFA